MSYTYEYAEMVAAELRRFVSEEEYDDIGVEAIDHGTALILVASRYGRQTQVKLEDFTDTGLKLAAEDLQSWFRKRELN